MTNQRKDNSAELPKPYDFVPLPEVTDEQLTRAIGHQTIMGKANDAVLSGYISAQITAESTISIASGRIIPAEDLVRYDDVIKESFGDDLIVMEHVRSNQRRIIPGTTLKGLIRSAVEAISYTGTTFKANHRDRVRKSKGQSITVTDIANQSQNPKLTPPPGPPKLSLSARLFGVTSGRYGYQGHCFFTDAPQISGSGQLFRRLPLYSPQPSYSQSLPELRTRWERYFTTPKRDTFRGRKFYRAGEPREVAEPYNAVEVCSAGSTFNLKIRFENLNVEEIGVLLLTLGVGGEIPRLRVGGGKPLAMGSIRFEQVRLFKVGQERYLSFDNPGDQEVADLGIFINAIRESHDLFSDGLKKLAEIMRVRATYTAGGDDRNY